LKFYLLLFLAIPLFLNAQDSTKKISDWSGFLSGAGLYQSGNTNKFYIQGAGELKRAGKILETILFGSIGYGENKGRKDENEIIAAFTADLFYENKFSPFILQYLNYSFAKGIDLRSQSGGGIKYVPIKNEKNKTSISAALIYDYENLTSKPGNFDQDKLRFSFRLKTKQDLFKEHLIFTMVAFFQPDISQVSSANFWIDSNLKVPVHKKISFTVNYLYTFQDVVSVGRVRADNKLTFGMRFDFGQ